MKERCGGAEEQPWLGGVDWTGVNNFAAGSRAHFIVGEEASVRLEPALLPSPVSRLLVKIPENGAVEARITDIKYITLC